MAIIGAVGLLAQLSSVGKLTLTLPHQSFADDLDNFAGHNNFNCASNPNPE